MLGERGRAGKKCRTVVPNRSAEGQRTEVTSHFSNGRKRSSEPTSFAERLRTIVLQLFLSGFALPLIAGKTAYKRLRYSSAPVTMSRATC